MLSVLKKKDKKPIWNINLKIKEFEVRIILINTLIHKYMYLLDEQPKNTSYEKKMNRLIYQKSKMQLVLFKLREYSKQLDQEIEEFEIMDEPDNLNIEEFEIILPDEKIEYNKPNNNDHLFNNNDVLELIKKSNDYVEKSTFEIEEPVNKTKVIDNHKSLSSKSYNKPVDIIHNEKKLLYREILDNNKLTDSQKAKKLRQTKLFLNASKVRHKELNLNELESEYFKQII